MQIAAVDAAADFVPALIDGDREWCAPLADRALANRVSVIRLCLDFYQKALHRIGELWADKRISVATEHRATIFPTGERENGLCRLKLGGYGCPTRDA